MAVKPTYTWQCPRCGFLGPTLEVPVIQVSHPCKGQSSRRRRDWGVVLAELPLTVPAHRREPRNNGAA